MPPDYVDQGQPNLDLRPYIGTNILPMGGETEQEDPFCGEVPNDGKGYRQYKEFHEAKMTRLLGGQKFAMIEYNCEYRDEQGRPRSLNGKKEGHKGAGAVIACHHVIHEDPEHPDGVKFVPFKRDSTNGLYLCFTCLKFYERHRLNLDNDVSMKCSRCVLDTIMEIGKYRPDKLINLLDAK